MVQLHPSERRRYPRVPFSSPIEFQSALGLETALACDLSGGGIRVTGHTALALGSDVWLKFKPPATPRPMFLQGRVVRLGPPTTSPGEHDGFAIGFVDPAGANLEELDRSVRRYLVESGLEAVEPAPTEAAARPLTCHVAYRNEREFIDAYTQHLCGGHIELSSHERLATGAAVELELELPNYYEILRVAARIESEAGSSGAETLYRARILEPTSDAMCFVHGFASVFLGSREVKKPQPAAVAAPPPIAEPTLATIPEPAPAPERAGDTDLTALVAEALSALDDHAVSEWKSPRVLLAPEEAAAAADSTRETQRIENIADLVAESYRDRAAAKAADLPRLAARPASPVSPAPATAAQRDLESRLKVSGKSAAEWAAALADVDPDVRAAAASALGKLGSTAAFAVTSLAAALGDRDPRVRRAAAWALGDVGPGAAEAVPALMDALADLDGRVRWRAIRALRAIGPAAALAVPELSRALTDDDDRVRQWAATALADLAGIGADAEASFPDLSV